MNFRDFIEDDKRLAEYIRSAAPQHPSLSTVTIGLSDITEYELQRLRAVAAKINFHNEHVAKTKLRYEIELRETVVPEHVLPDVVETRKKNNERTKKTSSAD
jgi:hypothetical protein